MLDLWLLMAVDCVGTCYIVLSGSSGCFGLCCGFAGLLFGFWFVCFDGWFAFAYGSRLIIYFRSVICCFV